MDQKHWTWSRDYCFIKFRRLRQAQGKGQPGAIRLPERLDSGKDQTHYGSIIRRLILHLQEADSTIQTRDLLVTHANNSNCWDKAPLKDKQNIHKKNTNR